MFRSWSGRGFCRRGRANYLDEYISAQLLEWYERIEDGILEFAEHVPLIHTNDVITSPRLASYLLDACGLIDSVFREMTPDPANIVQQVVRRGDCGIKEFAVLHSQELLLPKVRSILLVSPPRYFMPFKSWETVTSIQTYCDLEWWNSYNALKHDRLSHLSRATLGTALEALSALHQVLARRLDLVPILIRKGWFPVTYSRQFIIDEVAKGRLPAVFIVQSKLFATPTGTSLDPSADGQFPDPIEHLTLYNYQCKDDLLNFFRSS